MLHCGRHHLAAAHCHRGKMLLHLSQKSDRQESAPATLLAARTPADSAMPRLVMLLCAGAVALSNCCIASAAAAHDSLPADHHVIDDALLCLLLMTSVVLNTSVFWESVAKLLSSNRPCGLSSLVKGSIFQCSMPSWSQGLSFLCCRHNINCEDAMLDVMPHDT